MKRFFKKIFSLLFILLIAFGCYYKRDWFKARYHNLKGIYYIYRGDQAYSVDNLGKTIEYYTTGLRLFPKHYEAWFNLGNIYAVHEDYYSAVDAYIHAINAKPNFVLARMNLGIVYSEDLGYFDEAIEQFDKVTEIKPLKLWIPYIYSNVKSIKVNKALAHYNKGVAYKQKAMFLPLDKHYLVYEYLGDAIEAYTQAIKIIKKSNDFYYNRAVAHHLRGEYKEAGLDYCKAIQIEPMNFASHYNLAVLLRGMNHNRDSITELEKAAFLITESSSSSSLQTAYIFNLLNEVTRRFITSEEYNTQKLTETQNTDSSYTYINGKLVAEDDFDNAMVNNFKSCAGFEVFNSEEE